MTNKPATEETTAQGPKKEVTALSVATALALYKEDLHNPNIWKGDSGFCANIDKAIDMLLAPAKALDASETVDLSWIDGMRKPYGDFENPKCQCKTCQSKNGWNACIDAITGRLKGAGE